MKLLTGALFFLDYLRYFTYKKGGKQHQPLIMFQKSLYLTIVLPLICSCVLFCIGCQGIHHEKEALPTNAIILRGHLINGSSFYLENEEDELVLDSIYWPNETPEIDTHQSWRKYPLNGYRSQYLPEVEFCTEEYYRYRNTYQPKMHYFWLAADHVTTQYEDFHECCPLYVEVVLIPQKCKENSWLDSTLQLVRYNRIEPPHAEFVDKMHRDYREQIKSGRGLKLCGKHSDELKVGYLVQSEGNFSTDSCTESTGTEAQRFQQRYAEKYARKTD